MSYSEIANIPVDGGTGRDPGGKNALDTTRSFEMVAWNVIAGSLYLRPHTDSSAESLPKGKSRAVAFDKTAAVPLAPTTTAAAAASASVVVAVGTTGTASDALSSTDYVVVLMARSR